MGQGEAPVRIARVGRLMVSSVTGGWGVIRRAVRLICAGWLPQGGAFGRSGTACLGSSVAGPEGSAAKRGNVGRSTRCRLWSCSTKASSWGVLFVYDGQGPAPAGKLAGDRDVGDHGLLAAGGEGVPACVEPPVPGIAAGTRGCREVPPIAHRIAGPVPGTVVPGGLDEQSLRAWVLPVLVIEPWTRVAPEECSEGTSPMNEPIVLPVNRWKSPISTVSAKGGQRRVALQAAQPAHQWGELRVGGHRGDRHVETLPAGRDAQHGVVIRLERPLGCGQVEVLSS